MGKEEGRVVGLWPGSCLHALRALQHPRWEDFDYIRIDKMRNRFSWLGDGSTWNEKTMTGDRAWYLDDDNVDYPPSMFSHYGSLIFLSLIMIMVLVPEDP